MQPVDERIRRNPKVLSWQRERDNKRKRAGHRAFRVVRKHAHTFRTQEYMQDAL